jgi:hypothetical protein
VGQWFAAFATLAAVLYVIYRDSWKRPRLILSFDKNKDVKDQSKTIGVTDPEANSRWLRIRIQNKPGRRVAKNCRGYLIGIRKVWADTAEFQDVFPNDVRPLVWTHSPNEITRDLLPGVVHQLDLIGIEEGQRCLPVQCIPPFSLDIQATYVFTVQVSAEDAEPEHITVKIRWGGGWNSLDALD